MRIVTANVNGIRAAARKGGLEALAGYEADVLALQEVRASDAQLAEVLAGSPLEGWHRVTGVSSEKGRAGVALLTPHEASRTQVELEHEDFTTAGRWVEADLGLGDAGVTVVSAYIHSGEAGTVRQDAKYAYLEAVGARLAELRAAGRPAVVVGDLNIAHRELDIKNWKANTKKAGFLPEEREHVSRWLDAGWVDVGRAHAGDVPGPYTWWSMRGRAFDNDAGWRIDYHLVTPDLAAKIDSVVVDRAVTWDTRWSDHAAVIVDYRV